MCGNGRRTAGMKVILVRLQMAVRGQQATVRDGWFEEDRGPIVLGMCVPPAVKDILQRYGTTSAVFVLLGQIRFPDLSLILHE